MMARDSQIWWFLALAIALFPSWIKGQPVWSPSPSPTNNPTQTAVTKEQADPLVGDTQPLSESLRNPNKRDAQVIREAEAAKVYEPLSKSELGYGIPRISALKTVRITLDFNTQILLQETTVRGNAGAVQVQEGTFDTIITGSISPQVTRYDRTINNSSSPGATPYPNPLIARSGVIAYELGLQKTLENGIVINPSVGFTQGMNSDYNNQFSDTNQGSLNFQVLIPLAKGAGTLVNKAPEIAARFDLLASVLQLRFITAQSVLGTLQAYWACKAAEENYRLQLEAVASATRLINISVSLVKGDELAPAQLPQILADRDSAVANLAQAEGALIAARQTLAVAMGFSASTLLLAPLTKDDFPQPPEIEHYPDVKNLIFTAMASRDDLRSLRQLTKSQKVLMDAAYLNLRPAVNLQILSNYGQMQTRSNINITTGNTWQVGAGLSLNWPVENNSAIGSWIQSQASYRSSTVTVENSEMSVVSSVVTALAQLKAAAANVKYYRDSVRWYQQALAAQEKLFQLGQGTLIDTITVRQRLITAQLNYIASQQTYASSLAQIRFACGTLFFSDTKGNWIDGQVWRTVPFASLPTP